MFWPASFGSFGISKLENFRPLPLIKLPGGRSIDKAAARTSSGAIDLAFGSTSLNLLIALVELLGGRLHLRPQGGRIHQHRQIADEQSVDRGADRVLQVRHGVS